MNADSDGVQSVHCHVCKKAFSKKKYCTRHLKFVHKIDHNGSLISNETKVSCVICDKTFSCKSSLQRHIDKLHIPEKHKPDFLKCSLCSYKSQSKYNLARHISNIHENNKSKAPSTKVAYKCEKCSAKYQWERSLKRHLKKYHGVMPQGRQSTRKCPICPFTTESTKSSALDNHFETTHKITLNWETHKFKSFDELKQWKDTMAKNTKTSWIKKYKSETTEIFYCHRRGVYKPTGKGKRHLKIQGSRKINGFCPAMIKVKRTEDNLTALYQTTHVGHANDIKHLQLTNSERRQIATKLARKVPHEEILKEIRNTVSEGELNRIHLTQKKDIYNIERSFNLNRDSMLHQYDPVSVEAWVETLKTSSDTALLFYKPQGEECEMYGLKKDDFVLIFMTEAQKALLETFGNDTVCVDGTFGLNNYRFQLYTLMVLDECREGFPVSFMFTNRGDEFIYNIFYNEIKSVTGTIEANIFMSDMEEAFYSAWVRSMGSAKKRLYCTWHVLKAWRSNLNGKVKNKEKRDGTYKILKTILYELDSEAFQKLLNAAMLRMKKDDETKEFYEYFEKYYVRNNKFESWAYCHRINAGINTNMSVENFNKILKYIYLKGKRVVRLDKTLSAILCFIKDKLYDMMIKMKKGKLVTKLQALRKRHTNSLSLKAENVVRVENEWHVLSSGNDEFYIVKRIKECKTCQLLCAECNSCFHEFVCSCIDNVIKNNMCKHIHLVAINSIRRDKEDSNPTIQENCNTLEKVIEMEISSEKEKVSKEEEKRKVIEEVEELLTFLKSDSISAEQISYLKDVTKKTKITLEAMTMDRDLHAEEPIQHEPKYGKIDPQRRFYSKTAKKQRKKDSFTSGERNDIAIDLLMDQSQHSESLQELKQPSH